MHTVLAYTHRTRRPDPEGRLHVATSLEKSEVFQVFDLWRWWHVTKREPILTYSIFDPPCVTKTRNTAKVSHPAAGKLQRWRFESTNPYWLGEGEWDQPLWRSFCVTTRWQYKQPCWCRLCGPLGVVSPIRTDTNETDTTVRSAKRTANDCCWKEQKNRTCTCETLFSIHYLEFWHAMFAEIGILRVNWYIYHSRVVLLPIIFLFRSNPTMNRSR